MQIEGFSDALKQQIAAEVAAQLATIERKEVFTIGEAAEFLSCSERWLHDGRYQGYGPEYVQDGRFIRYTRAALLAWLASKERRP